MSRLVFVFILLSFLNRAVAAEGDAVPTPETAKSCSLKLGDRLIVTLQEKSLRVGGEHPAPSAIYGFGDDGQLELLSPMQGSANHYIAIRDSRRSLREQFALNVDSIGQVVKISPVQRVGTGAYLEFWPARFKSILEKLASLGVDLSQVEVVGARGWEMDTFSALELKELITPQDLNWGNFYGRVAASAAGTPLEVKAAIEAIRYDYQRFGPQYRPLLEAILAKPPRPREPAPYRESAQFVLLQLRGSDAGVPPDWLFER